MRFVPCKDISELKLFNNVDGSISAFYSPSLNQLVPYPLTKPCCENIGGVFDVNTQKCFRKGVTSGCDYTLPFDLVLNPKGSDGVNFITLEDEVCTLSIEFDFMFKFDCNVLSKFIGKKIIIYT